eukprot:672842-Amphidinium_carterae.1
MPRVNCMQTCCNLWTFVTKSVSGTSPPASAQYLWVSNARTHTSRQSRHFAGTSQGGMRLRKCEAVR